MSQRKSLYLVLLFFFLGLSLSRAQTCTPTCKNGGSCLTGNSCFCNTDTSGWAGERCETPICEGGCGSGNCTAPNKCKCGSGWKGKNCETPICTTPCQNGGNCTGVNACTCPPGWSGTFCEIALCNPPCKNGGFCVSPPDVCNCTEAIGWTGPHCDQALCQTKTCQHGGICSGPDTCDCSKTGYGGFQCEFEINECLKKNPAPCDPLTTCTNTPGSYECSDCPEWYVGDGKTGCRWDPCSLGVCSNLTTCTLNEESKTWTCGACPEGYRGDGKVCEDINECIEKNPCTVVELCMNTIGSWDCVACNQLPPEQAQGCPKIGEKNSSSSSSSSSSLLLLLLLISHFFLK